MHTWFVNAIVAHEPGRQKAEGRRQKAEVRTHTQTRHPESAERDEGSQNTKSLQFRDPSRSTRLRMTDFFTTSQDDGPRVCLSLLLSAFCFLPSAFYNGPCAEVAPRSEEHTS